MCAIIAIVRLFAMPASRNRDNPYPQLHCCRGVTQHESLMSKRIEKSWTVFVSVENSGHDRCVDMFSRPDGSYGFEEFRRDVEDGGQWTPVQYYSGIAYVSPTDALDA